MTPKLIREIFIHISVLASVLICGSHLGAQLAFVTNNDSAVFSGLGPTQIESGTAYYLPGTTGWGATFGGWPTAWWYQPRPLIRGLSRESNGLQFTISWATNNSVIVEACTNLASPVWTALTTNSLVQGTNYFCDPQWMGFRDRFYRAVAWP